MKENPSTPAIPKNSFLMVYEATLHKDVMVSQIGSPYRNLPGVNKFLHDSPLLSILTICSLEIVFNCNIPNYTRPFYLNLFSHQSVKSSFPIFTPLADKLLSLRGVLNLPPRFSKIIRSKISPQEIHLQPQKCSWRP